MKILIKTAALFCALIFSISLFSCTNDGESIRLNYFNTYIHIRTEDNPLSEDSLLRLEELFSSLEREFSINEENSFVNKFNDANSDDVIPVSDTAMQILKSAKTCHEFSMEKFNPAIYPLIKLWQFAPNYPVSDFSVPQKESISSILSSPSINFNTLNLNEEQRTVTKPYDDMQIDLGGILKGYAADKAAEILIADGHQSGYVDVGGSSLKLLSTKTLGVRHPRPTEKLTTILEVNVKELKNVSVSTSGDYQKYYTLDGKKYSHIIDPTSGAPSNYGVVSATIICSDGIFADSITTALCTLKHSESDSELLLLINKIKTEQADAKIFVVYQTENQKTIFTNQKQGEDFALHDNSYNVKNV